MLGKITNNVIDNSACKSRKAHRAKTIMKDNGTQHKTHFNRFLLVLKNKAEMNNFKIVSPAGLCFQSLFPEISGTLLSAAAPFCLWSRLCLSRFVPYRCLCNLESSPPDVCVKILWVLLPFFSYTVIQACVQPKESIIITLYPYILIMLCV